MQVSVAVYTFVASIFAIFLLWGTKNLGLLGLLSSFSVGMIAYSFSDSLEIGVASIIFAGILIKFLYPYIQRRWVENYANYTAEDVHKIIKDSQSKFNGSNASGLAPKIEGFQNELGVGGAATRPRLANASAPTGGAGAVGAGTVGAGTVGAGNVGAGNVRTGAVGAGTVGTGAGTVGTGAGTVGTGAGAVGAGAGAAMGAGAGATASMAAATAGNAMPGTASAMLNTASPAMAGGAANNATDMTSSTANGSTVIMPSVNRSGGTAVETNQRMQPTDMSSVQAAAPATASEPASVTNEQQQQNIMNPSGSPAAATSESTAEISPFANMETNGMFKLGQLPSNANNGPHIDAGTTIMRALGALNTDQIGSLTSDTRKLLDTQKSLMNMLTTMKPMLSDGQNLLASFTNMFGKQ